MQKRRTRQLLAVAVAAVTTAATAGGNGSVAEAGGETFLDFGANFTFGLVQDAYQFEGSLDADGAGASALHVWCAWNIARPSPQNGGWELCGDVGAGFYAHMREDVALLASLGARHLHFQIAWQRVLPQGADGGPNEAGLAFYDALVDALIGAGITPWASLEVFDFPQTFATRWGGWLGLEMVAEYKSLAELLFARFGDRVKRWFSFHEPNSLCASYPTGGRFVGPRPNANDSTVQDPLRDHYTCTYVMLLAHAEAAAALRASPNGAGAELSIISDSSWLRPNTSSAADAAAVDRYMLWHLALWFEPVVTGSWPPEVVRAAGDRLPAFSPAQSAALRNSSTMLGINHYSTMLGAARTCALPAPGEAGDAFESDLCVDVFCDARCGPNPNPALQWLHDDPLGMRAVLNWTARRYPGVPILVAESGVGLDGGSAGDPRSSGVLEVDVADAEKISYLTRYWAQAWLAMTRDGVDLRAIFHWSFLDNLEWNSGFAAHFGIVHVNHSRADLPSGCYEDLNPFRRPESRALYLLE